MAIFDLQTKTIKHPKWDSGDEVVIREMTFGESSQLTSAAMGDVSMADFDDKEKRSQLKMDLLDMSKSEVGTLEVCIVSWTFKENGKAVKLNYQNIARLPGWVGDYIKEEIDKLSPAKDDEFLGEAGAISQK